MKGLPRLSLLAVFLALTTSYARPTADSDRVELLADKLTRTDPVLRGSGHVRARIDGLAIQADEGAWNSETKELEMRGHVQLTFPERTDHTVFRSGSGNIVTDKAVTFHADRVTVKDGVLAAWGNLVIRPIDPDVWEYTVPQLQGDQMSMNLKTADATVRGNIRTNNVGPTIPALAPLSRYPMVFPPEIIK